MNSLRLGAFSVMLAMGGLPLYVHLPEYAGSRLGISLAALGIMLLVFRLIDMVQDPLLGRLIDRQQNALGRLSLIATALMVVGFLGVFVTPVRGTQTSAVMGLTVFAFLLFTGYSALNILLYRQSSRLQETTMPTAARTREIGLLLGVILGSVLPFAFGALKLNAYVAYGLTLSAFAIFASLFARTLWQNNDPLSAPIHWRDLQSIGASKLLLLLFLNTLPVAVTSTLFVFFVRDRLELPSYTGGYLALFFLSSMVGVAGFARLTARYSARQLLIVAMLGSILVFLWAFFLPTKSALGFALICAFSGVFLGCELYLLPVIFAKLLHRNQLQAGAAFGIWSFVSKLGLAIAATFVLGVLSWMGYQATGENSARAITALAAVYALLPCLLKLAALGLVFTLPREVI